MKKEFLDEMYELRSSVISDIARLEREKNSPNTICAKCKQEAHTETFAELRTRRSQLNSLDATITGYIKHHKS